MAWYKKWIIALVIFVGLVLAIVLHHRWARRQPPSAAFSIKVFEVVAPQDLLAAKLKDYVAQRQNHMVVVIPSFNNARFYKSNLDSVFCQDYQNYSVIYIDDASTDKTGDLVFSYVKKYGQEHRTKLIKNPMNQGAMANIYRAISNLSADDIVVMLDGDDWLAKPDVLSLINKAYNKYDILMTYGSYQHFPYKGRKALYMEAFPKDVIKHNQFRSHKWVSGPLRTFRASLFQQIRQDDLMYKGQFVPVVSDLAMMLPMLEMAGSRHLFIPDVLYLYNYITPYSDNRLYKEKCDFFEFLIRQKKPYVASIAKRGLVHD